MILNYIVITKRKSRTNIPPFELNKSIELIVCIYDRLKHLQLSRNVNKFRINLDLNFRKKDVISHS